MIIDVKKLKSRGIIDYDFEFDYNPPENLISLPRTAFKGSAKVKGVAMIYEDYIIVDADVSFVLIGECSRCLDTAEVEISAGLEEKFLDKKSDTEYYYINDKLDLSAAVNDLIIMNMPFILLCRNDCKGLCSKCGVNLNKHECKCE